MKHSIMTALAVGFCLAALAGTSLSSPVATTVSVAGCSASAAQGAAKGMACTPSAGTDVTPVVPPTAGHTRCSDEGGTCALEAPPTVTAWVFQATMDQPIPNAGMVRFGKGLQWSPPQAVKAGDRCSTALFGLPQAGYDDGRVCELRITAPAVVQGPRGSMPVVNMALLPARHMGSTTADVRKLTNQEKSPPSPMVATRADIGAFREPCRFASMQNIDPIVFPGKVGVGHMHTLMGNDAVNENSTYDTMIATGGSTCAGGTLNRTAYWMPTMVDVSTGQPIVPDSSNQYYKQGYLGVQPGRMVKFPPGLKMIAGDGKATKPSGWPTRWSCSTGSLAGQWTDHIPADCAPGSDLTANINFPACWDGKNLDSPNHKDHMAYAVPPKGCPADHPVALADHSQNWHYTVGEAGTKNWRLSSDMYDGPAGYSLHSDWFGAWDPVTNQKWLDGCANVKMDCHDNLLGLTETLY